MSCNEVISTSAKSESDADLAGEAVGPEETACGAGSDAAETPGHDEAGGVTLCQGFDGLGFREHAGLPGEKGLDAGAQARPIALGEIELAAEVEQGDLADLFAGAFGDDETEREVGFAIGFIPGRGFAYELVWVWGGAAGGVNRPLIILWHYNRFPKIIGGNRGVSGSSLRCVARKVLKIG